MRTVPGTTLPGRAACPAAAAAGPTAEQSSNSSASSTGRVTSQAASRSAKSHWASTNERSTRWAHRNGLASRISLVRDTGRALSVQSGSMRESSVASSSRKVSLSGKKNSYLSRSRRSSACVKPARERLPAVVGVVDLEHRQLHDRPVDEVVDRGVPVEGGDDVVAASRRRTPARCPRCRRVTTFSWRSARSASATPPLVRRDSTPGVGQLAGLDVVQHRLDDPAHLGERERAVADPEQRQGGQGDRRDRGDPVDADEDLERGLLQREASGGGVPVAVGERPGLRSSAGSPAVGERLPQRERLAEAHVHRAVRPTLGARVARRASADPPGSWPSRSARRPSGALPGAGRA